MFNVLRAWQGEFQVYLDEYLASVDTLPGYLYALFLSLFINHVYCLCLCLLNLQRIAPCDTVISGLVDFFFCLLFFWDIIVISGFLLLVYYSFWIPAFGLLMSWT